MSSRAWLVGLAAILAAVACNDDDTDDASFDYGRDEMKEAIEGTWEGTSKAEGGAESPVTLKLTYTTPDARPQCGNRVLSSGAIAPRCMDLSSINVTGTLTSRPAASEAPRDVLVRGTFEVMSLRFNGQGELQAEVDGDRLGASLANDVLQGDVQGRDGALRWRFTLQRKK